MVSNITEIADAINNLNATFDEITTDNIIPLAIQNTNASSDGWVGLTVFIILCLAAFIHVYKNKNLFGIFNNFNLVFLSFSVFIDIGIYLLIWGIVESIQIFVFMFTVFFILAFFSLMKKELQSLET